MTSWSDSKQWVNSGAVKEELVLFEDILQGSGICPKLEILGKLQRLGCYIKKPTH
jgi:hypothetical protein